MVAVSVPFRIPPPGLFAIEIVTVPVAPVSNVPPALSISTVSPNGLPAETDPGGWAEITSWLVSW